jgi:hypothetical protein
MLDYQSVLSGLRERRTAIAKELEQVDAAISALEPLAKPNTWQLVIPMPASAQTSIAQVSFRGMTLPRAIQAHMEAVNRPQTTREIIDSLKVGGIHSKAASFDNQVYNALHRMSGEDGLYARDGTTWVLRYRPSENGGLLREAR